MPTAVSVTLPTFTVVAETGFTVTRLREFLTSSLSDSALQLYLDAAMDAIDDVLGPLTVHEHVHGIHGELLRLAAEADTITTVVEEGVTLAVDDYTLSDSGAILRRRHAGTHPRHGWGWRLDLTYFRKDDVAERIRAAVALVKLELGFQPGLVSQSIGTWSETYSATSMKPYAEQRAEILASLSDGGGLV